MFGQSARKASRGTLSSYVLGINPTWGQPLPEEAASDASGYITPSRMREIVIKTPTIAAAMNSVLDYAGGVPIAMRNVDASKPVPSKQVQAVRKLLVTPNPNQSRRQFMLTLMRDIFTLGFGAIEIEYDNGDFRTGKPVNLWVLDAARLKIDFDEHGTIRGYDMLDIRGVPIVRGQDRDRVGGVNNIFPSGPGIGATSLAPDDRLMAHAWEPEEVIFFSLNPMSESAYPYSRITQLFSSAVIEDLMLFFISQRFTDSNIPFGVMDLGDVTEQELKIAVDNWNTQANESHHILLTGTKGGGKFIPFGYHLKDLEATALLAEVRMKIMGIVGVTMNELGESQDVNKSNGYNLSFTFKKRAIEPLLNEIVETLTRRLLWDTLSFTDMEFYYEEIDSRDDLVQAQIDEANLKMGVITINDIRNRKGMPNVPGGEVNMVFTGSAWIPVSLITSMAQALLAAEKASTQGVSQTGPDGADTARIKTGGNKQSGGSGKAEGTVHAVRGVTGSKQ